MHGRSSVNSRSECLKVVDRFRGQIREEWYKAQSDEFGWPSPLLQELLISGEDHRFGSHAGYDLHAIARSIRTRIATGRIEGASTIAQQLVRVLTCRYERTIGRKIREIALASLVTAAFPRQILPGLYLRVGYYGWGMTGLLAAQRRLRLDGSRLSLRDASRIVARLKYPEPRVMSRSRAALLERRATHLIALRQKHLAGSVYVGLGGDSLHAAIQNAWAP